MSFAPSMWLQHSCILFGKSQHTMAFKWDIICFSSIISYGKNRKLSKLWYQVFKTLLTLLYKICNTFANTVKAKSVVCHYTAITPIIIACFFVVNVITKSIFYPLTWSDLDYGLYIKSFWFIFQWNALLLHSVSSMEVLVHMVKSLSYTGMKKC